MVNVRIWCVTLKLTLTLVPALHTFSKVWQCTSKTGNSTLAIVLIYYIMPVPLPLCHWFLSCISKCPLLFGSVVTTCPWHGIKEPVCGKTMDSHAEKRSVCFLHALCIWDSTQTSSTCHVSTMHLPDTMHTVKHRLILFSLLSLFLLKEGYISWIGYWMIWLIWTKKIPNWI